MYKQIIKDFWYFCEKNIYISFTKETRNDENNQKMKRKKKKIKINRKQKRAEMQH